jgi:hypothetical protein
VRARFAQAGRSGERAGAMIVETAQVRGKVALGHGEKGKDGVGPRAADRR